LAITSGLSGFGRHALFHGQLLELRLFRGKKILDLARGDLKQLSKSMSILLANKSVHFSHDANRSQ
jgi:hypothetical protein